MFQIFREKFLRKFLVKVIHDELPGIIFPNYRRKNFFDRFRKKKTYEYQKICYFDLKLPILTKQNPLMIFLSMVMLISITKIIVQDF